MEGRGFRSVVSPAAAASFTSGTAEFILCRFEVLDAACFVDEDGVRGRCVRVCVRAVRRCLAEMTAAAISLSRFCSLMSP